MIKRIFLIILICFISACSTTHYKGEGIILSEKKISNRDFNPHEGTKTGAVVGGSMGAITGAAFGGAIGFAFGAFAGCNALGAIATTLGGGAIGALFIGTVGAAIGGGSGYMIDVINHPASYQYIVQPSYQTKTITITQYAPPIPAYSKVRILEKNQNTYIERESTEK